MCAINKDSTTPLNSCKIIFHKNFYLQHHNKWFIICIMTNKKNINSISQKSIILNEEDGQSKKLEEKRSSNKKTSQRSLFNKDVNDPTERGHD